MIENNSWNYIKSNTSHDIKDQIRKKQNKNLLDTTVTKLVKNLQTELDREQKLTLTQELVYKVIDILCAKKINEVDKKIQKKFFDSVRPCLNLTKNMKQICHAHKEKHKNKTYEDLLKYLYSKAYKKVTPRALSDLNFNLLRLLSEDERLDDFIVAKVSNALLFKATRKKILAYFPKRTAIKIVQKLIEKYKNPPPGENPFLLIPLNLLVVDFLNTAILNNHKFIIPTLIQNKRFVDRETKKQFHDDFEKLRLENKINEEQFQLFQNVQQQL